MEQAATEAERACDIDPLCLTVNTNAAWVHYVAGNYDAAVQHCAHAIELDATFVAPRRMRGAVLLQTGDRALALAELEEAVRIGGTDPVSWAWLAHALAVDGRRPDAQALVSRLEDLASERYVPAYHLALAHAGLDDLDSAFELLDLACDERDPSLLGARVDPRFDALRHDARYGSLLDRLGIDRGSPDRVGNRAQAGLEPIS